MVTRSNGNEIDYGSICDRLTQQICKRIVDHDGADALNSMWPMRSAMLMAGLSVALIALHHNGILELSAERIFEHMPFDKAEDVSKRTDVPDNATRALRKYLHSVPSLSGDDKRNELYRYCIMRFLVTDFFRTSIYPIIEQCALALEQGHIEATSEPLGL